jgi:hypothetical protein
MLMSQSQRDPRVPKSADDKNQSKVFIEAARKLGCDDDPAHFDEILKKVARHKAPADQQKKVKTARKETD